MVDPIKIENGTYFLDLPHMATAISQVASFYVEGIQKLVFCYKYICLNNGRNYVENSVIIWLL